MKIQSINDIITNSSQEVFMVISEDIILNLRSLVNQLVKQLGCKETGNEMFEILPNIAGYEDNIKTFILTGIYNDHYGNIEYYKEKMINHFVRNTYSYEYPLCENEKDITPEIMEKGMFDYIDCSYRMRRHPIIYDFKIKPKKPMYAKAAEIIYNMLHCPEYKDFYC